MYVFKANQDQVFRLFSNAFIASKSMGLGKVSFDSEHSFTTDDFAGLRHWKGGFCADYVYGRMMKLRIYSHEYGWIVNPGLNSEDDPRIDYQSWAEKYPTWPDLFKSADIDDWKQLKRR